MKTALLWTGVFVLFLGVHAPAHAQTTNTWIAAGAGNWHDGFNWSAGVAPTSSFALVSITNLPGKTAVIDTFTQASARGTMTISNLLLSANGLRIFPGVSPWPLRVLNGFAISDSSAFRMTSGGGLIVEGRSGGRFDIDGSVLLDSSTTVIATNAGLVTTIGRTLPATFTMAYTPITTLFWELVLGNSAAASATLQTSETFGNSTIGVSNNLTVGLAGSTNKIIIAFGSYMNNDRGFIGSNAGANSNNVTVYGAGARWENRGNLSVGFSGSYNSLVISNGGKVSDIIGHLGNNAGGNNNSALVTGPSSVWTNSNELRVGNFGAGNSLVISNGGAVVNALGTVGFNANASNNTALVTGADSLWSNSSDLRVGNIGARNSLVISNGGSAIASNVYIGVDPASVSNAITVSGGSLTVTNTPGSSTLDVRRGTATLNGGTTAVNQLLLTNGTSSVLVFNSGTLISGGTAVSNFQNFVIGNTGTGNANFIANGGQHRFTNDFVVGNQSAGNAAVISNAASVLNPNGIIGSNTTATGNSVLVTGIGSVWSNRNDLYVGNSGSGNSLVITNAGAVAANNVYVGFASLSNAITVAAGSLTVTGVLDVRRGTLTFNGGNIAVNQLLLTNGNNSRLVFRAGTLISRGTVVSNFQNFVIGDTGVGGLSFIANGGQHRFTNDWFVGNQSAGNSAIISNAANVVNANGIIGSNTTSTGNRVLVTGIGSVWSNRNDLYVGLSGAGNSLVISNGATVIDNLASIGSMTTASGNSVLVTDPGSVWSHDTVLYVGFQGAGSRLVITNGGAVFNATGTIGQLASNNSVLVTGTGSVWSNSAFLNIGENPSAPGNSLVISNGGAVVSGQAIVGDNSVSNRVLVTGTGSVWSNQTLNFTIGADGSDNSLVIDKGGAVIDEYAGVGKNTDASGNIVLVTGTGSVWSNRNNISIGFSGPGNSLVVGNGGVVFNRDATLGDISSGDNNSVLVTGTNSFWRNAGNVFIGVNGAGNSLLVSNAGAVTASNIHVGVSSGGINNTITMKGGSLNAYTALIIGNFACTSAGTVTVAGGSLFVTNNTGTAKLEIRSGALVLNSGTLRIDTIVISNACATFSQTGGTFIYSNAVLSANGDVDGDGVPNGADPGPFDPTDAGADPDGDGFTNLQESQAGTSPTNSASALRILSIAPSGPDLVVTWTTVPGRSNALQAVTSPGFSTNFTDIFTNNAATGTQTNFTDPGAASIAPARFYRVRLLP